MKRNYKLLAAAELLIFVTFLFVGFAVVQSGVAAAENQFITCVDNNFDHRKVLNEMIVMDAPERFLQTLSSELEKLPYDKTAAVINQKGEIAVLSSPHQVKKNKDEIEEKKLQGYLDAAHTAFLGSDFQPPRWVKSTEKNTAVHFDFYGIVNEIPTVLYVEFVLSPLTAVFTNDNFLFLFIETIIILFFMQLAAFLFFREYSKKKEKLEKSHSYFINGIAHEIKTPITEIINLTECAAMTDLAQDKDEYLRTISDCSEKMNQTVNLFLKNSFYLNEREVNKTKFSLSDVVKNKMSEFLPLYNGKGIVIHADYAEHSSIRADRQLIEIVIDNFLSNALKYTDSGCEVRIKTYLKGKKVVFSVYNQTNQPVDCKEIWDSAFGPDKGTGRIHGLGLNLSKKILRLHRFRYGCRAEEGGVLFFFEAKSLSCKKG